MNDNYRNLNRRLDLAGALEREEARKAEREAQQDAQQEVNEAAEAYRAALVKARKQEQVPQQVPATSVAARERGLRSYNPAAYREYDVQKLKELQERDPVLFFFKFANTSLDRA